MEIFIIPALSTVIFLAVSVASALFGAAMHKAGYQRGYWAGYRHGHDAGVGQAEANALLGATMPREAVRQ